LNKARQCPAIAFLRNTFLYAIGGTDNNEIELLDVTVRSIWILLKLESNPLSAKDTPEAMKISDNQLLIFRGNDTARAEVFNVMSKEFRKCLICTVNDDFIANSVTEIKGKIYLMGTRGSIHIYDKNTKKLEELAYESIFI
jgi:hypothetical protein